METNFLLFNGLPVAGASFTVALNGYDLTVANTSTIPAIITGVWIDGGHWTEPAGFFQDDNANLPGGNVIGWDSGDDVVFRAEAPPTKNGIAPGESLTFTGTEPFTGQVALHVQSIGEAATSASYVATVPEPTAVALLPIALTFALLRRLPRK